MIDPLEPAAIFLHSGKYLTRSGGTRASIPARKKYGIFIIASLLVLANKQTRFTRNLKLLKITWPGLKDLVLKVVFALNAAYEHFVGF